MAIKPKEALAANATLVNNLAPLGLRFEKDAIAYGNSECVGMTVTRLPTKAPFEWLTEVCNLNNTITAITYFPEENPEDILKAIGNTVSSNQLIADGTVSSDPVERIRAQKVVEDGTRLLEQIANNNESIGYMAFNLMAVGQDRADVRKKAQAVKNKFVGRQFRVSTIPFLQKEVFQAVSPCDMPGAFLGNVANNLIPMSAMLGGFPFAFAGYNDGEGVYIGMDDSGAPIILDIWKRGGKRTNSNMVIMGQSGMGKSTVLKMMLESEWELGTKILVIDVQNECKELCKKLNGDWIDVVGGEGGRINILQIYQQAEEEDDAAQKRMSPLAKQVNNLEVFFRLYLDLSPVQVAILKECLEETYREKGITWDTDVTRLRPDQFPILTDLYNAAGRKAEEYEVKLSHNEQNHYKELHLLLRNIAIGADATIWNGISTLNLQNDFVVFNTSSVIGTSKNIQSALYHTVLNYCEDYLYRNRHERVILVVDEAHIMIDRRLPDTIARLARIEKTCRKFESALWVCSQQLVDFLDPAIKKEGSALLDQPNIKLLMPVNRGQDLRELKELYNLTDAEEERLVQGDRGLGLLFVGPRRLSVNIVVPPFRLSDMGSGGGS